MDVNQYLEIFIEETKEHLQSMNEHILVLEKEPNNQDTINEIFRAAHSLKGMAGTMGYKKMQTLTHDMENVFMEIRNGNMKASSDLVDVLFKGLDVLEAFLANIQADGTEGDLTCEDIIADLNNILSKGLKTADKDSKAADTSTGKKSRVDADQIPEGKEKDKFRALVIEEHEKKAIAKALSLGLNVVGLTVYIQEYCVLKGARAFMVNRTLDEHGDIIKLFPNAQDLEDEKYDFDYSAFVITKESPEQLANHIMNISEIKEAEPTT